METVILVSVLSTLGVVAIAVAFVVMFKKLNNKVDVNEQNNYDIEFQDIHRELDDLSNNLNRRIDESENQQGSELENIYLNVSRRIDDLEQNQNQGLASTHDDLSKLIDELRNGFSIEFDNVNRTVDSRCDKLYDLIPKEDKVI